MDLATIITRNNQACLAIHAQQVAPAVHEFTTLLSQARRILDASPPSNKNSKNQTALLVALDDCMTAGRAYCSASVASCASRYVYANPILLPPNVLLHQDNKSNNINHEEVVSHTNAALVSVVVMFNLALCFHLLSQSMLQCPSNNNNRLQLMKKSAKIYELAYKLHLEEGLDDRNMLFSLAIINNLGILHESFGSQEAATSCFEQLLSTLMFMVDQKVTSCSDLLEGFLGNTTLVDTHAAAA